MPSILHLKPLIAYPPCRADAADFAGLLDDAYSLSHVRQLNISIFLQLVKSLGARARPELPPWKTALGWLQRMTDVLSTAALLDRHGDGERWKDCMSDLKKYVTREVTKPFIQNVNVPGQDEPGLTFQVGKARQSQEPVEGCEAADQKTIWSSTAGHWSRCAVCHWPVTLLSTQPWLFGRVHRLCMSAGVLHTVALSHPPLSSLGLLSCCAAGVPQRPT